MKEFVLLISLFLITTHSFSQKIHTTTEIIKIMSDSKLSYEFKPLDTKIECKDLSEKLNNHDYYRVVNASGITSHIFEHSNNSKLLIEKADNFFNNHNTDSAFVYYQLAIKAEPTSSSVMTNMGQIYAGKGDHRKAIEWYRKAVGQNYIDYLAHWHLAESYLAINDLKNAFDEIIIAQILDRNNPKIQTSMTLIFGKTNIKIIDWCFNPQVELSKISNEKIELKSNDIWTPYAVTKALWMFEPGYRESAGISQGLYSTIEEKECLMSLLVGLANEKIDVKDDTQLRILKEAVEKKHLEEYILYEIILPQTPSVAFQLPEQTILNIKDYILNIRNSYDFKGTNKR